MWSLVGTFITRMFSCWICSLTRWYLIWICFVRSCAVLQHSSCIMCYGLFFALTIYVRCMVRTTTTLSLYYSTAQYVVYLRHWELSVINGRILFYFALLGTFLLLLHLWYCWFLVSIRQMTQSHLKRVFLIYVSDGRLWRQRVRAVLTCCDERAWHDMGAYVAGGVKRVHDVREMGLQR